MSQTCCFRGWCSVRVRLPSVRLWAPDDGGRGTAGGFRARRMTSMLLVGEIALTVVLLVGAGLLGRSFLAAQRLDFGMDTSHLLAARIKLPPASYPNPSDDITFVDRLVE